MKIANKILCIILALGIALMQLPITALAYNENVPTFQAEQKDAVSQDGNWKYDVALDKNSEPRVWIKDYLGNSNETEFVIPSTIDGMRVQSVELVPNANLSNVRRIVKKVVFEENIERIAGNGFMGLKDLQIVFPSSLLMIDSYTFYTSKNLAVDFPYGLRSIGDNAFLNCTFSSTEIVFPESLEFIGTDAFNNTNITCVKIGSRANFTSSMFSQTIGAYNDRSPQYPCTPFSNCSSLTKLEIDENNPYFKTKDGIIYTSDEKELVFINSAPLDYRVPESVEYICPDVFKNKTFGSLVVSSDIQNFGSVTFSGSTIEKLSFAEGCKYESIVTNNFKNSKIDEITIPKSIKRIDNEAFYKCGIKKLTFEEGSELSEIGARAFKSNELETLDLTPCKLLLEANQEAFCGNKQLTSVDMTDVPIDALATMMFCHCYELKEFKLSKYTKTIGTEAFEYDSKLEDIDLSNIAQAYSLAFRNCDKINIDDYILSSGTTENGYQYNELENHISLVGYTGDTNELVMPDEINGKPVTDIVWSANMIFRNKRINSVKLPEKLEFISSYAFQYTQVQELSELPDTLRYIGGWAFSGCSFNELTLNEGLEYVLSAAFQWCPFESLEIPDSVIYYCGGMNSTENSITFGKNVRNIKSTIDVTNADYRAANIYISPENPYYCFENGVLYNKEKTEIYKCYPWYNVDEINSNYQIPETVKRIDKEAFNECKVLGDLIIPASVEYIGKKAFCRTNVTSVHFADGFKTETLDRTFSYCRNLKKVTFGNAEVKNLIYTYADSGVENIDIPESVENITGAYEMTKLSSVKELKLPEGLKILGDWSFGYSDLAIEEIVIPKGVEAIGYSAFARCRKLKTIDFGNVKFLSRLAFENCSSLESIDLTGIKYIAENHWSGTFAGCTNLKKITFNRTDRGSDIEENANENNASIETAVIGNGIKNVKSKAFASCKNLKAAVISDSVETIADDAFEDCDKLIIVCTEDSSAMKYAQRNNVNYKTFKIHPIPDQLYTGKAIRPQLFITVGETELNAGEDYTASYVDNIAIGTAKAIAVGLGDYSIYAATVKFSIFCDHKNVAKAVKENVVNATYTKNGSYDSVVYCEHCGAELSRKKVSTPKLEKKANTLSVKGKTATVKYSKLKKSNQSVSKDKALTVSKAQGKVTYSKTSGNKKITINKTTGKITVKKGLKKGTYKVKIKVSAAGNSTYKALSKTVTVTIKVK